MRVEPVAVVRAVDVGKVYRMGKVDVPALRGVNFEVPRGEFLIFMGPSGSGKSSLLNIIGAVDMPSWGKLYFEGRDILTLGDEELIEIRRQKVGYIYQLYYLLPVLTALRNVEMPMVIAGVPSSERRKRAMELLKLVGMGDKADRKPSQLSGGEQQRVAIARALANSPVVVLADEPTADLDTETGKEVMGLLHRLTEDVGVTIIAVTHDPVVAEYADRIILLRDGLIVGEKRLSGGIEVA
ncbi:MAG: ABC transporter ATP-binding protein [Candidatus Bathyarchaeia archaeon]